MHRHTGPAPMPPKEVVIYDAQENNVSTVEAREAEKVTLTCASRESKPPAELRWLKNHQVMPTGRQNVHDDERSGSPVTATDNAAVAAVRNVVEADRRVQRMEAARAFLEMHQRDGDQLFSSIVTGDESWVHRSTPETKRQSMVWKKPEESAPKKAKVTISAGKVMAMENFKWEIFTHPPYSPELAPSDFHLYPALKWHLGGKHFANDDEVQAEANHWLRRQDTAWYNSGI
ncbi:hypothetical protein LAZ67_22000452 [Cordylochernes scorpioides]|uniref:Ig-like domain-containing protein n=1 Tax=Cordylochernes scorpioides TaxID=51811 RepID=A0ABY6LQR5_9ARAC|nr:hypothetical protein LAZ67_22000452 [Cordylochernes scorpioides]